jgi:hypothetical protein
MDDLIILDFTKIEINILDIILKYKDVYDEITEQRYNLYLINGTNSKLVTFLKTNNKEEYKFNNLFWLNENFFGDPKFDNTYLGINTKFIKSLLDKFIKKNKFPNQVIDLFYKLLSKINIKFSEKKYLYTVVYLISLITSDDNDYSSEQRPGD